MKIVQIPELTRKLRVRHPDGREIDFAVAEIDIDMMETLQGLQAKNADVKSEQTEAEKIAQATENIKFIRTQLDALFPGNDRNDFKGIPMRQLQEMIREAYSLAIEDVRPSEEIKKPQSRSGRRNSRSRKTA